MFFANQMLTFSELGVEGKEKFYLSSQQSGRDGGPTPAGGRVSGNPPAQPVSSTPACGKRAPHPG